MNRILLLLTLTMSTNVHAQIKTISMPYAQCISTREQVIVGLEVNPADIVPIVNSNLLTITRICTAEGSVLITCSNPDSKMLIQQSKARNGCAAKSKGKLNTKH